MVYILPQVGCRAVAVRKYALPYLFECQLQLFTRDGSDAPADISDRMELISDFGNGS